MNICNKETRRGGRTGNFLSRDFWFQKRALHRATILSNANANGFDQNIQQGKTVWFTILAIWNNIQA